MRTRDLFSLAARSIHPGFGAAYALLTAFAVACFCFSAAIRASVNGEKAEPCELTVTAPSYLDITEQTVQDILAIPDVTAATGLVEVPVTAVSGKYTANLTLVGIDGDYLDAVYSAGGIFPPAGAMPWLILSEAAAGSFIDPADRTKRDSGYMPAIDWLNADFALTVGEDVISAKVSGIFEGETPAAYISQSTAKQLSQRRGYPSGYSSALVRVTNIGAAEAVTKAIHGLGFQVANMDSARREKWDIQLREAVYILILGAAALFCSVMLEAAESAANRQERRQRGDALRWVGMTDAAIRKLDFLRHLYLDILGILLGVFIHYAVAAFIPLGQRAASSFALTASWFLLGTTAAIVLAIQSGVSWTFFSRDYFQKK